MRLIISFNLKHEKITNDYRGFLLSFLKFSLSKEYDDFFQKTYLDGPLAKPFSFSVYIKNLIHENGFIISPHKTITMIISSNDYELILLLYNSMLLNKNKYTPIKPNNSAKLIRISLKYLDEITENEIQIKMLSPLLVRLHEKESNVDEYLTIQDNKFEEKLNDNVKRMLKDFNIVDDSFLIEPIKANKVVVPIMRINYDATLGTFLLKGKKETLNLLYKIGIGSRRNYGFGLFEIKWIKVYIFYQKESL